MFHKYLILVLIMVLPTCFLGGGSGSGDDDLGLPGAVGPSGSDGQVARHNSDDDANDQESLTPSNRNYRAEVAKRQKHTLNFTYHVFSYRGSSLLFSTFTDGVEKVDTLSSTILTLDAEALVDMDGDGDLDILGCNREAVPRAMWYENRLDERKIPVRHVIEKPILDNKIYGLGGLIAVDFDGDGNKDIIGLASQHLVAFVNNGKTEPWGMTLIGDLSRPVVFTVRDVDGDGDQDLFYAGTVRGNAGSTKGLMWIENVDGKGKQWSSGKPIFTETDSISTILAADFDGDKDVDIALFETHLNRLLLHTNEGNGAKWKQYIVHDWEGTTAAQGLHPNRLRAGDLDGNGKAELITTHRDNTVFRWDYVGGATGLKATKLFDLHPADVNGPTARQIAVTDFDGDGNKELLISLGAGGGTVAPIYWFQYKQRSWQKQDIGRGLDYPVQRVVVADYDGDGDDDIVTSANSAPPFPLIWFEN